MKNRDLPATWRALPFGQFLQPANRRFKLEDDVEYRICGVRWYGNGAFIRDITPGRDVKIKNKNIIHTGDVVYSKLFAWRGSFAVIEGELDGCCVSDEFPIYQLDESLVLPRYLHWYFLSERIRNDAERSSRGVSAASRFRLHERDFAKLELPAPPLPEQRRILARIDALAARIAEAQVLQTEATKLAEAVLVSTKDKIFARTLGDSPAVCLGDIAQIRAGVTLGRKPSGSIIQVPYLRVANVQDGFLDLREMKEVAILESERMKWALQEGDLLLTEGGDWDKLGRGAVWHGEIANCIHQNHIFRVRVDTSEYDPQYLSALIGSPYGKAYFQQVSKQTTNLATINQGELKAFRIPRIPIAEQRCLIAYLDRVQSRADALKQLQEKSQEEVDALLPSVLDKAFRGEL